MRNQNDHKHPFSLQWVGSLPLAPRALARLGLTGIIAPNTPKETLIMALQDPIWEKRVAAVKAIGEMEGEKCIDLLKKALQDMHKAVRAMATKALGNLGESVPTESLIGMLQDPCWEVR